MKKLSSLFIMCMVMILGVLSYHDDVNAANKISISNKSVTLTLSKKKSDKTATLKLHGVSKKKVTWNSSNTKIVTVGKTTGKLVAKKAGKTTVTAKVKGSKKTYKCTVYVKSTKISKKSLTLQKGKSATITLKNAKSGKKISNKKLKWTSNKKSVATVKNGKITAVGVGTTTITVYQKGKKDATKRTCKVSVIDSQNDENDTTTDDKEMTVTISAPSSALKANATHNMKVTIANNKIVKDQKIIWIESGDEYIGTIDDKNVFNGIDLDGTMEVYCYVKGKDKNGKSVTRKSNTVKIEVKTGYTYELFALSNFYNAGYHADSGISAGEGAVYIKTNRTDWKEEADLNDFCFALINMNGEPITYASAVSPTRFFNINGYDKDSTYTALHPLSQCWINGGFTANVEIGSFVGVEQSGFVTDGDYTLALVREVATCSYVPVAQLQVHVYDREELFQDWANYFLDNHAKGLTTNHEKMLAMADFMNSYFYNNAADCTHNIGLSFISGAGGSVNTPNVLKKFGEEILEYEGLVLEHPNEHGNVVVLDANGKVKYRYEVPNGVSSVTTENVARLNNPGRFSSIDDLIKAFKDQKLYKNYENPEMEVARNFPNPANPSN